MIQSLSEESIFYTNRARCYKILQEYERAIKDTQSAIELDEKNVKAHLISGQVLAEIGKKEVNNSKIEMAISRLKKALLICSSEKNSSYTNEINIYIYRAKKLLWYKKFNEIRERRINAITEYKVLHVLPRYILRRIKLWHRKMPSRNSRSSWRPPTIRSRCRSLTTSCAKSPMI